MSKTFSVSTESACRRMTRFVLLVSVVGVFLYSVVLAPLYTQMDANILYRDTVWPTVLYFAMQAVEPIMFLLVYSALFYALWRGGLKGMRPGLIIFGALTVAKYVCNFAATCITDGSLPSMESFLVDDLPVIGWMLALELIQHALVVYISIRIYRSYRYTFPLTEEGSEEDRFLAAREGVFPFDRLLGMKNPVQLMAFATAMVLLVGRVSSHLIYQITLLLFNGQTDGWMVITFDMVADLVIATVGYLVMTQLVAAFDRKELLALAAEEA